MKTFCLATMVVVFLLLYTKGIQAQETVATNGGNAIGSGGTISYTIGQVAYTTNKSTTGTVTQGVQQPYEVFVVTGIEDDNGISLEISVYPNPTATFLRLIVENCKVEILSYQLYDVNGSLLQNGKIVNKETIIKIGDLAPAAYYLRISDNQEEVKTIKIIKF